jgi:hypothetical protein
MYGRSFLQSRQIAAYGSEESPETLKYSGTEVPLQKEHPPILQEIQKYVEDKLQTTFNHCMLNRYDDGSVYIGSHSDNLGEADRITTTSRYEYDLMSAIRKLVYRIYIAWCRARLHLTAQETADQRRSDEVQEALAFKRW